ncbi:MAG: FtsW/RodA/SpoVE family cell cycle protein, partial [Alphaproteobacteria bacterium]
MSYRSLFRDGMNVVEKIKAISWPFIVLITLAASIGFVSLYSAASGSMQPWAASQMVKFAMGMVGLIITAVIDIRIWMRLAYPIFLASLALLVVVDIHGHTSMGAQRWIDLGFLKLQPSELMKVAIVLTLARFFQGATPEDVRNPLFLLAPLGLLAAPVALVLLQPDLGTAMMLVAVAGAMFFI